LEKIPAGPARHENFRRWSALAVKVSLGADCYPAGHARKLVDHGLNVGVDPGPEPETQPLADAVRSSAGGPAFELAEVATRYCGGDAHALDDNKVAGTLVLRGPRVRVRSADPGDRCATAQPLG